MTLPAITMLVDRQGGIYWKDVWELFEHDLRLKCPAMIISLHLYIGTYLAGYNMLGWINSKNFQKKCGNEVKE